MDTLVISSHEDAIAAVPHVLGFHPKESLVLVPFNQALPWVRVDLPRTAAELSLMWDESLRDVLDTHTRRAGGPVGVAVLCFTADRRNAETISRNMSERLGEIGVGVPVRLWTNDSAWAEFNTAASGPCSRDAADRMAASSVYGGRLRPVESRETMAASMVGDREPVAALLPGLEAAHSTPAAEWAWAVTRVDGFLNDGARLSDAHAARLLVAVQVTATRDALWGQMTRDSAREHQALWVDMTRRAPDEVRAPAAALAAFSSWLAGDGAKAWCALDQVPNETYTMAAIVAGALEAALPPTEWDEHRATLAALTSELDESFVPRSVAQPEGQVPQPNRSVRGHPGPPR